MKIVKKLTVDITHLNARVDTFISEQFDHISRSQVSTIIAKGGVCINGKLIKRPSKRLKQNDIIELSYSVEEESTDSRLTVYEFPLEILYEDSNLVAVNKPAGMVVHPGVNTGENTLVHALLHVRPVVRHVGGERNGLIHRLDKDTSGVILIAKTSTALRYYSSLFENRKIKKKYAGIIQGDFSSLEEGVSVIGGYMRRIGDRKKFGLFKHPPGKLSSTKVIFSQLFSHKGEDYSLLSIYPKTGRTHQIRVHLKSIGKPLVGDVIYGGLQHSHLLLHATNLEFRALDGKQKRIEAPLPDYFLSFIKSV